MNIAAYSKTNVPTTYAESESNLTTAKVGTVDQQGTEAELPRETYQAPQQTAQATPQPEPQQMAQATPPPADNMADRTATPAQTLPTTGSVYPLIGLLGLFSLAGFVTIRAFRLS